MNLEKQIVSIQGANRRRILKYLQENGSTLRRELGLKLRMSESTTTIEIRNLSEVGLVTNNGFHWHKMISLTPEYLRLIRTISEYDKEELKYKKQTNELQIYV